ncbi:MAG TPA: Zn-ribbon domain-containing OB-fold protein [Candidatus Thermoplasmatota archaeon]|jgi:hypothetical protein|nr:Zn-ribbon domain-containing OB-fold protein [Candidatus Thermoplasmatota archaeon]
MKLFRGEAPAAPPPRPYLLDFYPLQDEEHTRISPFFEALREGKLTTTQCKQCQALHWQPRVVCPQCLSDQLAWVELPTEGTLYAFTALEKGAPLGMEHDMPFSLGVVELDAPGRTLRILSRLDDADFGSLRIGQRVKLKVLDLPDGRVFYRFTPA